MPTLPTRPCPPYAVCTIMRRVLHLIFYHIEKPVSISLFAGFSARFFALLLHRQKNHGAVRSTRRRVLCFDICLIYVRGSPDGYHLCRSPRRHARSGRAVKRLACYLLASSTATATATVAPTIGLLPMPLISRFCRKPYCFRRRFPTAFLTGEQIFVYSYILR